MPTVKHPARTTLGFLCTAGIALAAATPAAASLRPTAADPAAISAAGSAIKAASAAQATSTRSRAEAERAVADTTALLDSDMHTLVTARAKLTQLSALVDEAADQRLGKRSGLLDVAAGVTDVAAEVAGAVAPVIEALDPLAEVVGRDASPEHRLTPLPGGAERELRLVRAAAIREQRAAAEEVSRAQRELDTAAGALATARDAEQHGRQPRATTLKCSPRRSASTTGWFDQVTASYRAHTARGSTRSPAAAGRTRGSTSNTATDWPTPRHAEPLSRSAAIRRMATSSRSPMGRGSALVTPTWRPPW